MLGITEITLQIHRGQIMRKMAATSFAELVRMCSAIGIPDARKPQKRPTGNRPVPSDRGSDGVK
jgi:hypothetical protein